MKVAIVGSRAITDYTAVCQAMERFSEIHGMPTEIVSGGALGVDILGARWCYEFLRTKPTIIRPRWRNGGRYNPQAGKDRNRDIVEASDAVVALWDGVSNGTANTLAWAAYYHRPMEISLIVPDQTEGMRGHGTGR